MKKIIPVAFVCLIVIFACDKVYFTSPQPADSKNLHEFPATFRGIWINGDDSTTVTKNHFKRVEYTELAISRTELDTSSVIVLYNDKIYYRDTNENIVLRGGFPYKIKNDSLYYTAREIVEIDLGSDAFLRKAGKNYILNVNRDNIWWELFMIQQNDSGDILAKCLSPDDIQLMEKSTVIYSGQGQHFIDSKMDEKDMSNFIKKGAFRDTVYHLTSDTKKKK